MLYNKSFPLFFERRFLVDLLTVFVSTFLLVFMGELGDKTQIAAGTGTLANRRQAGTIFFSSALALVTVAGVTVFLAGLIPQSYLPILTKIGGGFLIVYGLYLFFKKDNDTDDKTAPDLKSAWGLFLIQFFTVLANEIGDKTQFATLGSALKNQTNLLVVFTASASALVAVTGLTVFLATKIPASWAVRLQYIGAGLMIVYGIYMIA